MTDSKFKNAKAVRRVKTKPKKIRTRVRKLGVFEFNVILTLKRAIKERLHTRFFYFL